MSGAELPTRVLATELVTSLQGRASVATDFGYDHVIKYASRSLGMRVEDLEHEPLLGMGRSNLRPTHETTVAAESDDGHILVSSWR